MDHFIKKGRHTKIDLELKSIIAESIQELDKITVNISEILNKVTSSSNLTKTERDDIAIYAGEMLHENLTDFRSIIVKIRNYLTKRINMDNEEWSENSIKIFLNRVKLSHIEFKCELSHQLLCSYNFQLKSSQTANSLEEYTRGTINKFNAIFNVGGIDDDGKVEPHQV